jgi:hypothetical protein
MLKQIIFLFGICILFRQSLIAQQNIPVIKATSNKVDIRDGKKFRRAYWDISPEIKPDIYWSSSKDQNVTFYTDLDSISFYVQPGKDYYFIILMNGKDSALTLVKYIDLVQMKFPVSLISKWDSINNPHKVVKKEKIDSSFILPNDFDKRFGKPYLWSIRPCLVRNNREKSLPSDTLWVGESTIVDGKDMVDLEIPFSSINPAKNIKLSFRVEYAHQVKLPHSGLGGWKTEINSPQSLDPPSQPFRFTVESIPTNAEIYIIDKPTWDFHSDQLKQDFRILNRTYDLNTFPDKEAILQLLDQFLNPMELPTPTDIFVFDTPYFLILKLDNKIRCTKIEPNRQVPDMNKRRVNLNS